jgi:hypothetical protein
MAVTGKAKIEGEARNVVAVGQLDERLGEPQPELIAV